jgi:hypothetical protein
MNLRRCSASLVLVMLLAPFLARAEQEAVIRLAAVPHEDALPGIPFKEGEVLGMQDLERLKGYIPEPFWENRDLLFFEGMNLRIGEPYKEYPVSKERALATQKYGGQARIGRDESLENYTMGTPFPEVDPLDPQAAVKHAWNFIYKHDALEGRASFFFTYWDQGEQLPFWVEGVAWGVRLGNRPDFMEQGGDVFPQEKRAGAGGIKIDSPADLRGILALGYRYKDLDKPRDEAREVDVWVYVPDLRRVRRISGSRRTDSVAGTDASGEDWRGFNGVVTHFTWEYLGEVDVLAPMDSQLRGYPYSKEENFGPTGYSLANDVWEVRKAIILEMKPKDSGHPYTRKTLWVDKETYNVLYATAYDRRGQLWKLIYGARHYSEREDQPHRIEGVNAFLPSCDIVVNVVTATGVRVEFFDAQPTRMRRGLVRKAIDIGRLSRQGR